MLNIENLDLGSSSAIEIPMSDIDKYEIFIKLLQKNQTS